MSEFSGKCCGRDVTTVTSANLLEGRCSVMNPGLMMEARQWASGKRRETGKSDSQRVAERDGGSVHTALEGEQKRRLTGEPVRIDRPISSCQRELIWHQQSLYVKKEKGRPDPRVRPRRDALSSFNERHATTAEDTRTREWLASRTWWRSGGCYASGKKEGDGLKIARNSSQMNVDSWNRLTTWQFAMKIKRKMMHCFMSV